MKSVNNSLLIDAFHKAMNLQLDLDFITLLGEELQRRKLITLSVE
ncbi:sporulation histidine kinase inhibitor Sda [Bacillus taeanensis]|uniref:Sporulation histidine kinase inhibitor Sda n=1 Tax=Bacillus taeanensis TaxID=273032 RepID=A0A366XPL4_9BACI|nr:sporulation histidine kinase inhibitor Sda [Bacillus taeanensis]